MLGILRTFFGLFLMAVGLLTVDDPLPAFAAASPWIFWIGAFLSWKLWAVILGLFFGRMIFR